MRLIRWNLYNPLVISLASTSTTVTAPESESLLPAPDHAAVPSAVAHESKWAVLLVSAFLVSVPVFFQAPLVRSLPLVSLALTLLLAACTRSLRKDPSTTVWGDLLWGFTWTWLAGTIYWGWFRWEPLLHIPIEAIGLPFALVGLRRGRNQIGHWFYLGSLLGTALTDLYFYLVNLIPYWRQLMQASFEQYASIFHQALAQMQTPWGIASAVVVLGVLLGTGCFPLRSRHLHQWAFGGAVLSTLLVDGLFLLVAMAG